MANSRKKRGMRLSSSFRKRKLAGILTGSGRKKQRRRSSMISPLQQRRDLSEDTFSESVLTESMVSTPVKDYLPQKKKRKLSNPNKSSSSSSVTKSRKNDKKTAIKASTTRTRLKQRPGKGNLVTVLNKNTGNVDKSTIEENRSKCAGAVGCCSDSQCSHRASQDTVGGDTDTREEGELSNSDVIVIEDDDLRNTSEVERLGEQMVEMVVPDSPKTILNNGWQVASGKKRQRLSKRDRNESCSTNVRVPRKGKKGEEVVDAAVAGSQERTIEIDDSVEVIDLSSTVEDVELVEEVRVRPLAANNIQEVTRRYQEQWPGYIPLQSSQGGGVKRGDRNTARSRGQGLLPPPSLLPPVFRPGPPRIGNFAFGPSAPSGHGVFRFGAALAPTAFRGGRGGTVNRRPEPHRQLVSHGPTIFNVGGEASNVPSSGLRPIVIDGSNVAMAHGKNKEFSCKGIQMVVDYFRSRGHDPIVAFVPQFRNKARQVKDKQVLDRLHKAGHVVFTPSREVGSTRITSYDDTFVLDYAARHGGVVVTRDNYRDLALQKTEWREVVEKRILMPTFVGEDDLMWPHDPMGKTGSNLDEFLRF